MEKQIDFNSAREILTDEDKQQIFDLLSSGLRQKNRDLLHRRIHHHLGMIPYHGILSRVMKEQHGWTYCAGQDYREEIKTVRKIILECK